MTSVQQTTCRAVTGRPVIVPGEVIAVRVNGCEVAVQADHRRWVTPATGASVCAGYEPVAVEVLAPMRLSLEDVTAMLFVGQTDPEELDDPTAMRELVADLVVNSGGVGIEEIRAQVPIPDYLDADDAAWLAYCRHRAATVFGVPDPRVGEVTR